MSIQIHNLHVVGIMGFIATLSLPITLFASVDSLESVHADGGRSAGMQLAAVIDTSKSAESFISKDRDSDGFRSGSDQTENATTPEPPESSAMPVKDKEVRATRSGDVTTPTESGADEAGNQQLPTAVIWYKELAEKGDKEAQYNLGAVYETGFGVSLNFEEATKWYLLAAEQDHVLAQLHLGVLYMLGKGVKESSIKGAKWIRAAAKNGNELAKMINDKVLSNDGEFKVDEKKVIAEVHAALENGDIYAQEKLIHVLAKSKKQQKNQPKKERFAGTVTGSGAKPGTVENEVPAFLDDKSRKPLTQEGDIASIRRHANEGDAESQFMLGRMYETGKQVEKDRTHAVTWYRNAASQGHRDAQYRLALSLIYGLGTEKNVVQGGEWLHKAAAQKHEVATRVINYFTSPESGAVNYNCSLAFAWYLERALKGDGDAQLSVGYILENGWGVYQNVNEARQWFLKSEASGTKGASGQLRQMKISQFEGELPKQRTPTVSNEISQPATNENIVDQAKPVSSQPKEKGFFDFDFNFNFGIPSAAKVRSLMVPIGLILIGLTLGMIVFRWMDRMMSSNGQQMPPQNNEESMFR